MHVLAQRRGGLAEDRRRGARPDLGHGAAGGHRHAGGGAVHRDPPRVEAAGGRSERGQAVAPVTGHGRGRRADRRAGADGRGRGREGPVQGGRRRRVGCRRRRSRQ